MENRILQKLSDEGLLLKEERSSIEKFYQQKPFSLHWEIKTILYLGVLLFSTGAGLIIYQNIDSISHQAILLFLAIACGACFYYCVKKGYPFSTSLVESPGLLFDYLLLLGCLLFLSFEGYFQFKYSIFGEHYGLATLFPAILFIFLAFRYDHKGILSMGITAIAAWMGLSVTPHDLYTGNAQFSEFSYIWTGLAFGALLVVSAFIIFTRDLKKHFVFSILNFAANALFVAALAGLFFCEGALTVVFIIILAVICFAGFRYAKKTHSFYFLLLSVVYGYIGLSYLFYLGIFKLDSFDVGLVYLSFFYQITSAILIVRFLTSTKKSLL